MAGARLVTLCLWALAVCASALVAHAAIDALGDVALTRDAYDFVEHGSRSLTAVAILVLLAAGALRIVFAALDAAGGDGAAFGALLAQAVPRSRTGFIVAVALGSVPALVGMEAFDVVASGGTIDDFGDLLAGAPLFSLTILGIVAVATATAVREAAAFLARSKRGILAAISACVRRRAMSGEARLPRAHDGLCAGFCNLLARRSRLRGPPAIMRTVLPSP